MNSTRTNAEANVQAAIQIFTRPAYAENTDIYNGQYTHDGDDCLCDALV